MPTRSYRDLIVWTKAMDLVVKCYRLAQLLPARERFGIRDQLCRAAVSVASNIAEGNFRVHRGEYVRFVSIARGSLAEVQTLIDLTQRLSYVSSDELSKAIELSDHVGRMLTRLLSRLRTSNMASNPESRIPNP